MVVVGDARGGGGRRRSARSVWPAARGTRTATWAGARPTPPAGTVVGPAPALPATTGAGRSGSSARRRRRAERRRVPPAVAAAAAVPDASASRRCRPTSGSTRRGRRPRARATSTPAAGTSTRARSSRDRAPHHRSAGSAMRSLEAVLDLGGGQGQRPGQHVEIGLAQRHRRARLGRAQRVDERQVAGQHLVGGRGRAGQRLGVAGGGQLVLVEVDDQVGAAGHELVGVDAVERDHGRSVVVGQGALAGLDGRPGRSTSKRVRAGGQLGRACARRCSRASWQQGAESPGRAPGSAASVVTQPSIADTEREGNDRCQPDTMARIETDLRTAVGGSVGAASVGRPWCGRQQHAVAERPPGDQGQRLEHDEARHLGRAPLAAAEGDGHLDDAPAVAGRRRRPSRSGSRSRRP